MVNQDVNNGMEESLMALKIMQRVSETYSHPLKSDLWETHKLPENTPEVVLKKLIDAYSTREGPYIQVEIQRDPLVLRLKNKGEGEQ